MELVEMMNGKTVPKVCVDALTAFEQEWPGATFHNARPAIAHRVLEAADTVAAYDTNGDMIAKRGQLFRRVGWMIRGGINDGMIVDVMTDEVKAMPHGGFSPVYVEIGD